MKISIVVPAFNAQKYLAETLEGVIAQTERNWETIIVDDGSTDETAAISRSYATRDHRIRLVQQPNAGLPSARNRGFAECDSNAVAIVFLDSDDVWEKDALRVLSSALEAAPDAVAAHGLGAYVDTEGRQFRVGSLEQWARLRRRVTGNTVESCPVSAPTTFKVLAVNNCVATPGAALVRRDALGRSGLFDARLVFGCEDYQLWLRLARLGDLAFVDHVVIRYRRHGANMSLQGRKMDLMNILARQLVLTSPDTTPEQRHILRVGYRYSQLIDARAWLRTFRQSLASGQLRDGANALRRSLRGGYRSIRGLDPN